MPITYPPCLNMRLNVFAEKAAGFRVMWRMLLSTNFKHLTLVFVRPADRVINAIAHYATLPPPPCFNIMLGNPPWKSRLLLLDIIACLQKCEGLGPKFMQGQRYKYSIPATIQSLHSYANRITNGILSIWWLTGESPWQLDSQECLFISVSGWPSVAI